MIVHTLQTTERYCYSFTFLQQLNMLFQSSSFLLGTGKDPIHFKVHNWVIQKFMWVWREFVTVFPYLNYAENINRGVMVVSESTTEIIQSPDTTIALRVPTPTGLHSCQYKNRNDLQQHVYDTHNRIVQQLRMRPFASIKISPEPLPFYDNEWRDFTFDISEQDTIDNMADRGLFDCQNSNIVINYRTCSNNTNQNLQTVRKSVQDNYRLDGHNILPGKHNMIIQDVDAEHFLNGVFPAWSMANRPIEHILVKRQLQEDICKLATIANSVCQIVNFGERLQLLNPYIGGDFNPFDMCDTRINNQEEIQVRECQLPAKLNDESVCKDINDQYFKGLPDCIQGRKSEYNNVEQSMPTNICDFTSPQDNSCPIEYGVVGGWKGMKKENLYEDDGPICSDLDICRTGRGLFWDGGNPIYHNGLSAINNTGLLKQNINDLGGHHIVLSIQPNGMFVERTPLLHAHVRRNEMRNIQTAQHVIQHSKVSYYFLVFTCMPSPYTVLLH